MSKRRQHYVPKFYLKAFQSASKRIHVCHLATLKSFRDASLRDQCYLHRFYGSIEVEDSLAELENVAAPVLKAICNSGEPPSLRSEEHAILLAFVSLQALRTPAAQQNIKNAWTKMSDQVFGDSEPDPASGLSRFSPMSETEALAVQLKMVPTVIDALSDLHLFAGRTSIKDKLVTSDNPLIRYNSYCRGIRYWGSLGANCLGLQIFLPLSPRIILLLYDPAIYRIEATSGNISKRDVDRFNAVQIFNAQECIYFSDWSGAAALEHLAREYAPRKADAMMVNEGPLVGSEESSIVHVWEQQPELPFSMPLSQLRLKASKVPPKDRINIYRTPD